MNKDIVNLNDGAVVDPARVLTGAWQAFVVRRIPGGESEHLDAEGVEHLIYVVSGSGTAIVSGGPVTFAEGSAFTVVRGDRMRFQAEQPLELFVATLRA